ncbi:MAG: flavodoxin family protein [Deltaproteobacteria bacterium]|nr:flavodoxin family protein [Deltaproteobacteria bacterium]
MKVLGIYGSERRGGNSDQLLDRALAGAEASGAIISKIYARDLMISGCRSCGGCDKTGVCVVKDDMSDVYKMFEEADVIILASPIYFYAMPGQVKCLVDRAQAMWSRRHLLKTPEQRKTYDSGKGYLIAVGATRGQNLFEGVQLTARYFYDALDMSYEGGIFFRKLDKKDAVNEHPEMLDEAFELGKKAAGAK